jgi:hypothetical protein
MVLIGMVPEAKPYGGAAAMRRPTEIVQVSLRLPEALRREIATAARRRDRSANAEMVKRLEQSLAKANLKSIGQLATAAEALLARIESAKENGGRGRPPSF